MWNCFSYLVNIFNEYNLRQFNVLISGPASSGKTAFILRQIKGKYVDPVNIEEIRTIRLRRENCLLDVFDNFFFRKEKSSYASSKSSEYTENTLESNFNKRKNVEMEIKNRNRILTHKCSGNKFDGILFFVDSSDYGRIPLARKLLCQLLMDLTDDKSIILIVASKQDVIGALTPSQLAIELKIDEIMQTFGSNIREYNIIGVSSYNGLGCNKALDWVTEAIWKKQTFCYCIPFNNFCYNVYNYNSSLLNR